MPDLPTGIYQRGQLVPATYAGFMQLPRGTAVPRQFHDNARMAAAMEALRQVDQDAPLSLLHADAHLGNMYFTGDGTPGFLDWQALAVGSYSQDVTYFIVSSLDIAQRPKWEKPLLMYYLERLKGYGASPVPDFPDAWQSYVKHIIYGLFYWLVNPVSFQAEMNNCAVAPRFAMAALEHDTLGKLGI
jgi:aminoglycoside phosphotransferase (APT) family kinase protein